MFDVSDTQQHLKSRFGYDVKCILLVTDNKSAVVDGLRIKVVDYAYRSSNSNTARSLLCPPITPTNLTPVKLRPNAISKCDYYY